MKTASKRVLAILLSALMLTGLFATAAFADDDDNWRSRIPAGILTEEEAKQIALDKAGISSGDAMWWDVEFDFEDGIFEYDVDFRSGGKFYNCEINAVTGEIVGFYSYNAGIWYSIADFFINLWRGFTKFIGVDVIV